jgi:hypothetical protein
MRQDDFLVGDFVIFLAQKRNSSASQFYNQSIFINNFVMALSQLPMNLHAKAHELKNLFPEK